MIHYPTLLRFFQVRKKEFGTCIYIVLASGIINMIVLPDSAPKPLALFKGVFDIIALAASAGGLDALRQILAALPADFPAGIVIVQHLDPRHPSLLAAILARCTQL